MKNLFKILSGLTLLSLAILPLSTSATITPEQIPTSCVIRIQVENCPAEGSPADYNTKFGNMTGAMCCLMSTIYNITNWIFMILMAVAVVMVIIGGFFMVTAAGNPEGFTKGRMLVIYALIGVVVALLAKFIPGIAKFIIGV